MGRLAETAGAKALTGKVTITDAKGNSRTFDNEVQAEVALGGAEVFHYRGAFWEVGCEPKGWPEEKARRARATADAKVADADAKRAEVAAEPLPENPVVLTEALPEPSAEDEETKKLSKKKAKKKRS